MCMKVSSVNNSPSFGKVLNFENQFAKIFEISTFNRSLPTKKAYNEFLDTFVKSEPINKFISEHDVNVKFERELDLESEVTRFAVSLEDPSVETVHPPVIWQAETFFDGLRESIGFNTLSEKISKLRDDNLTLGHRNLQAQAAEEEARIIEHKKWLNADMSDELKKIDERIQSSLDVIKNM